MSWLSSLAGKVKDGVVGAGHVVGQVASNPLVDAGIGAFFGPGAAAAAGGIGRLIAPGGNVGEAAKGAAIGGAAGYGGQFLKNHFFPSTPSDATPSTTAPESGGGGFLNGVENAAGAAGGFLKNAAGSALGAVTGGGSGGGTNPLLLALAAAQTANAAHLGQKADDYAQAATDQYASQAPLRSAGTSGLLTPRPPQSLSGLSAIRQQNPVAARSNPLQPQRV